MVLLIFISSSEKYTLPVGLVSIESQFLIRWTDLRAGGVICFLPVVAIFAYIQKWLVKGFTAGAVKDRPRLIEKY